MPISLTNEAKANIATYLIEVLLPDSMEAILREREGTANTYATGLGLLSAITSGVGALFTGPAFPAALAGGLAVGSIATAILAPLANVALSPAAARAQTDNAYWYLVKRRIFCSLPNSTDPSVLTEAVRNRIAERIQNIVPYSGGKFSSKTSANLIVSNTLRGFTTFELQEIFEAATSWQGNMNGTISLLDDPVGCGSDVALIPVIDDVGVIPFADQVSPNTWRIGSTALGNYRWRTAYPGQCYRIDGISVAQAPIRRSPNDPFIDYVDCNGNVIQVADPSDLDGVCFQDVRVLSNTPFSLYVTVSGDCGAPPLTHQGTIVQFLTPSSTHGENSGSVIRVVLTTNEALTQPVVANIAVDPNSTATLGSDFTLSATQLTFDAGDTSGATRDVVLNTLADALMEADEHIILRLASTTGGAVIGQPNLHVATIKEQRVFTAGWKQSWSIQDFCHQHTGCPNKWMATASQSIQPPPGSWMVGMIIKITLLDTNVPSNLNQSVDMGYFPPIIQADFGKDIAFVGTYFGNQDYTAEVNAFLLGRATERRNHVFAIQHPNTYTPTMSWNSQGAAGFIKFRVDYTPIFWTQPS